MNPGYQADNTKGWEATKSNDSADPKTIHDWNVQQAQDNLIILFKK